MAAEIGLATTNVELKHDKIANLRKFEEMIDDAASQGARIIVFPETAVQGYLWGIGHSFTPDEWRYHYANAETVPGPSTERLIEKAKQRNIVICFGLTEKADTVGGPILFDSAVTVSPAGLHGSYHKVHCGVGEKLAFQHGIRWPVYETAAGRVGTMICYDSIFPESSRELALQGAEILAFSTVWPSSNKEGYSSQDLGANHDLFCRARALENQVFFISSNACGRDDVSDMRFYGHSQIVGPNGQELANLGWDEGVAVVKVNVQQAIVEARTIDFNGLYFIKDRQPETYTHIGDPRVLYPGYARQG